jgi:hypothetical protein
MMHVNCRIGPKAGHEAIQSPCGQMYYDVVGNSNINGRLGTLGWVLAHKKEIPK